MQKFKDGDEVNVFKIMGFEDKLSQRGKIIKFEANGSLVLTPGLMGKKSLQELWCLNEDLQLIKKICQIY